MNTKLTEIVFILDRSGSMAGLENDTIGGFNGFIKEQLKLEGNACSTLILFDNEYEVLWEKRELSEAVLTDKEYYVRGSTALLDAIGNTILRVKHRNNDSNVIFVITTDGQENASCEFTYESISHLTKAQKKAGWEFIFLGANINEVDEAIKLGLEEANAHQFLCTEDGIDKMYNSINKVVSSYRK